MSIIGKIRKIKKSDMIACQNIIFSCLDMAANNDAQREKLKKHYSLKNLEKFAISSKVFYVFEKNSKVLGVGRLTKQNEIRTIYVWPKLHRKNIGTKIINRLEKYANENSVQKVHLHALTFAIGFYEKLGYDKSKDFMKRENRMEKKLKN